MKADRWLCGLGQVTSPLIRPSIKGCSVSLAGLKALLLEALDDLMGGSRPYWLYPSSSQSPSLVSAAAAAALPGPPVRCAGLGGKGAGLSHGRQGPSAQEAGQQHRETRLWGRPGELGLRGEKRQDPRTQT